MLPTLEQLQNALARGETTSVELTQAALDRIASPDAEGDKVFTRVYTQQALAAAQASDTLRSQGMVRSPLEGLPISIKDLFDVAGEATWAGSKVLKDAAPAQENAPIVQNLLQAGAVVVGKTNMTEFAFSGLGLNPHYGTPASLWDRASRRIPGGSSSGAGVSVADGMSVAAIGTDTGGSVRIPSAFNGLTGFKPTARRVSLMGSLPLSFSQDSIGPLAASVDCCAALDAILAGIPLPAAHRPALHLLRFVVPANGVFDGGDEVVKSAFDAALDLLRQAGAQIDTVEFPEFTQLPYINRKGGLIGAEAYYIHRERLETQADAYDPRVSTRIMRGKDISAADYLENLHARRDYIASVEARMRDYDALLMPTVPVIAPRIADLEASDDAYFAANGLILRNPTYINALDGCALSIPCHQPGQAPVGLMVAGPAMADAHILEVGRSVEAALAELRRA